MSGDVRVFNRQRARAVDTRLLRRMVQSLLEEIMGLEDFDLTLHLVNARAMAELNQMHLGHEGPTDVITLDYAAKEAQLSANSVAGEIFVCTDVVVEQARMFGVTWEEELARYIIHGILHLCGHDDRRAKQRSAMKREETRLLRELGKCFRLSRLARRIRLAA